MDRILVVEDSPTARAGLVRALERAGFAVETAATLAEGRAALTREPYPDLLLLDLGLPDGDGAELCREARSLDETARIPVLVLTAASEDEVRLRLLEIGADEFLVKPVDEGELLARVRTLLRAKHLSDRLLVSYLEMDRLGQLAESFLGRPVSEWSRAEVADALASHLLGAGSDRSLRPRAVCALMRTAAGWLGAAWWWEDGEFHGRPVSSAPPGRLEEELERYHRGGGRYLGNEPVPRELLRALGLPPHLELGNLAGVRWGDNLVVAAGYPWEVGSYELPLLRALHRHWNVFDRLRREAREVERAFFHTMEALAVAAEFYDGGTELHIRRVAELSARLARYAGRSDHEVRWLRHSAKVHDVGKITIPIELLAKRDRLTREERRWLECHTVNGERLLRGAGHLEMARRIARHHHECWDGSGYPDGLSGPQIPWEARIVKLVDVYDALRSRRPYKEALDHAAALELMRRGDERIRPEHFDPDLLALFLHHGQDLGGLYDALAEGVPAHG